MKYEIKKGKPIPSKSYKYPLEEMEVGDHFDIPYEGLTNDEIKRKMNLKRTAISIAARRCGVKVITRLIENEKVLRVWRTQ